MADQDVNKLKQAFDDVKAGLTTLHAGIQTLDRAIAADQYIAADTINLFANAVSAYRTQAERLESLGAELSVPIGGNIADIDEAIRAFEEKQHNSQIRALLLDYFRLTSDAARYSGALEESKRALMEKCADSSDKITDMLAPYTMAINYVRSDASSLPDDQFEVLVEAISERVASGIEKHAVRYDETLDVTPYFDGSCPLLMPEDGGTPDKQPASPNPIIEEAVEKIFSPKAAPDSPPAAPDTPLPGYGGFVAAATHKYFNNRPADELSFNQFIKLDLVKRSIPDILRRLAEEKLYTPNQESRSTIYRDTLNVLIAEGYVTTISIQSNLLSESYYTLTDKGWACLRNRKIVPFVKDSVRRSEDYAHFKLPLPDPLITAPQDMDAFRAVCTALIHEFFFKIRQSALVFNRSDNPLAFGVSLAAPALLAVPAVFEADGDLNTALDSLAALIGAHAQDRTLVLILACREDAFILSKALELDKFTGDIAFSVIEDSYSVYRLSGGALVPDETLAAPANAPAPAEVTHEDSAENTAAAAEDTAGSTSAMDAIEAAPEKAVPDIAAQKAAFIAALEKQGAFLSDEDNIGALTCTYSSDAEEKTVGYKIFLSDIQKGSNEAAAACAIRALCERAACTSSDYLTAIHPKMSKNVADYTLDKLRSRGYLRYYELPPFGSFYRASPRLEKAMQSEDARRYVRVSSQYAKDLRYNFEETAECAATRIAMLTMERDALPRFAEKNRVNPIVGKSSIDLVASGNMYSRSYAVQLAKGNTGNYLEIMFCALWRDAQECGTLFDTVEAMVQNAKSVDRMTIAAFTLDKAAALADSYFAASAQGGKCPVVMLYGLREGKYAAYRPAPEVE